MRNTKTIIGPCSHKSRVPQIRLPEKNMYVNKCIHPFTEGVKYSNGTYGFLFGLKS